MDFQHLPLYHKACDKAANSVTRKLEDLKFQVAGGVGDLLIKLLSVPHTYIVGYSLCTILHCGFFEGVLFLSLHRADDIWVSEEAECMILCFIFLPLRFS